MTLNDILIQILVVYDSITDIFSINLSYVYAT